MWDLEQDPDPDEKNNSGSATLTEIQLFKCCCLLWGRGVCAGAPSLRVEHPAVRGSWRSSHHLGHAQQGHPRHALQPYWRYIYVMYPYRKSTPSGTCTTRPSSPCTTTILKVHICNVRYPYRKFTPWWQISCCLVAWQTNHYCLRHVLSVL